MSKEGTYRFRSAIAELARLDRIRRESAAAWDEGRCMGYAEALQELGCTMQRDAEGSRLVVPRWAVAASSAEDTAAALLRHLRIYEFHAAHGTTERERELAGIELQAFLNGTFVAGYITVTDDSGKVVAFEPFDG